ncbi:DEAD-box ATP-dependent RNA helicase FANCM isoform X2 [Olea europaea subsp. europaea]|uniref:DEAD-box ATP-dependent RNA helicase FANCM isoform X2 n=1 Tax=Olea europaea subsp. europaea TaxID=158383 RepID=A0A8S0UJX1_OLEEU|nr:DEAD-box ATP-dependent RNA helicase FANCM isoform X2 [Olea europaea subsp. europaea]
MASTSAPLHTIDDDDEFDWEAAVREIDMACQNTANATSTSTSKCTSISSSDFKFNSNINLIPVQEISRNGKPGLKFGSSSAARQSTLDKFVVIPSNNSSKLKFTDGFHGNNSNSNNDGDEINGVAECYDIETLNGCLQIDPEAAKTWIYPVNIPRRDYQFSITKTALFSNTLVVLPTGLGKTLIAAVVMYNYFRWFPEGKIVFAAPSRPLVMQQIEACHKIVGIPQEWTIDLTGQTSPTRRASLWKDKRVFFVTPQVLEKDIHTGSCLVKHLVCLVIDEAHRAMGNYAYCVVVHKLMDISLQLRILALTATPGSKQQTIQNIIDNLQISTLEYRNENDPDVLPYVHERKIELMEVPIGKEAAEIYNLLGEVARPFAARLSTFGLLQKRDFQTLSPCDLLNSRDKFRQEPPPELPQTKFGEIEGCFGVLITLYHVRKLLSSHGIKPAFEMLEDKMKQWSFARVVSNNKFLSKAKLLMHETVSHGAPSPKLAKLLEVLIDHFKVKNPGNSRVIIFSNFRGSVRDIMNALENIKEIVKATEFIGQSSGKTLKGQSQKVQQAVLEKFRTGGYNVIVATSIGEEGLDIMEVDLVICFDANVSPLRMIQRMGRTGRKHEGRVVVLACEGSELKGYMRKQVNSKAIKKHMSNGGMNSFNFHSSPRMVPHIFKPEVQLVEISVEQFVPRGKKVKDDHLIQTPAYKTKLTDAETNILDKYFCSTREKGWRPSLIAFPHFQAFPCSVYSVAHSSMTGIFIDTMQNLQGLSFSTDSKTSMMQDEDFSRPCFRLEAEELYDQNTKENPGYSAEEELKTELPETDAELVDISRTKDMSMQDIHGQNSVAHSFLFDSEFVSVDDRGRVLVLSLSQLPLISLSKSTIGSNMEFVSNLMQDSSGFEASTKDFKEKTVQAKGTSTSQTRSTEVENSLSSSRKSNEKDSYDKDAKVERNRISMDIDDEENDDLRDFELSPRLTNFIKSGVVPESPISDSRISKGKGVDIMIQDFVSSPNMHSVFSMKSPQKVDGDGNVNQMEVLTSPHCQLGTSPLHLNNHTPKSCQSPFPVVEETRTPIAKLSNTSSSKDWALSSGGKCGSVEQPCKFRRLRKHGDLHQKMPSERKEQSGLIERLKKSSVTDGHAAVKHVRGQKRLAKGTTVYIDEEAEVSSEVMASEDEEDDANSTYDDSFIDDCVNSTAASTQAEVGRIDMMAIYRRSLLSQSPLERLPNFSTHISPDSTAPSIRTDKRTNLIGPQNHSLQTPQIGLDTSENESKTENQKRKLSFNQAQSIPMVNLENEFLLHSEAAQNNSPSRARTEENLDIFEDDRFFEDIDLDALEEQATKLLRYKSECSMQNQVRTSEPMAQNLDLPGSPSFDLGI